MTLLLAVAGLASAQTMIEYSAAAAGGSAAGVAGKSVSNGLDKVFKSVNQAAKEAEASLKSTKPKMPKAEPLAPAPGDATTPMTTPARTSHYATATRRYTATRSNAPVLPKKVESFNGQAVSPYVAQLVLPTVTPLDIAGVKAGMRAEDLTMQVGRPAARVVIPDGNRLVEILTYSSREGYAGSVKLSDGQVVDVKPAGKGTR